VQTKNFVPQPSGDNWQQRLVQIPPPPTTKFNGNQFSIFGEEHAYKCIALGYGLDDWGFRVLFPAGIGNFSLHQRDQNGSGAQPASYPMGTRGSFPGGKVAGA
jgi:hypothetical protein